MRVCIVKEKIWEKSRKSVRAKVENNQRRDFPTPPTCLAEDARFLARSFVEIYCRRVSRRARAFSMRLERRRINSDRYQRRRPRGRKEVACTFLCLSCESREAKSAPESTSRVSRCRKWRDREYEGIILF